MFKLYKMRSLFIYLALLSLLDLGQSQTPNVIVIITDDQGWADIGYNNPRVVTPHLDQLANTGVKLKKHRVMPQCTPTRVALMTGRYPSRFGIQAQTANNLPAFPLGTPTMASFLKQHGYETMLSGKWHLGSVPEHGPNFFGFDESHGSLTGAVGMYQHRYHDKSDTPYDPTWHRNHQIIPGSEDGRHVTDITRDDAVEFIERKREKPFFLYLPFHAPHTPLDERGQFVDIPTQPDPQNSERWLNEDKIKWFNDPEGKIQAEPSRDKRLLLATMYHVDEAVGDIIEALEITQQRENTIIFFSSDNGPWVNNRGGGYPDNYPLKDYNQPSPWRGKKLDVYEGGIHVPGFINWKGTLPAQEFEKDVHIVDWFPTLAGLLKLDQPEIEFDGMDLSPHFFKQHQQLESREFYWHWGNHQKNYRWALKSDDWKIVSYSNEPEKLSNWKLYQLNKDPQEKNNMASQHPEVMSRLHKSFLEQREKDRKDYWKRLNSIK
jgi:arylsulfatase A-like enzyme